MQDAVNANTPSADAFKALAAGIPPTSDQLAAYFKGALQEVDVADVNVDRDYQRQVAARTVKSIRAGFSFLLFQPPVVGRREDGTLWAVDGQSRLAGLQAIGFTGKLLCLVFSSKGKKHEAEVFDALVDAPTKHRAWSSYHARLCWGEPGAVALFEAFSRNGLILAAKTSLEDSSRTLGAAGPMAIVEAAGAKRGWTVKEMVDVYVDTACQLCRGDRAFFLDSDCTIGLIALIKRVAKTGRVTVPQLIERLGTVQLGDITERAHVARREHKLSVAKAFVMAAKEVYNDGLPDEQKWTELDDDTEA